MPGVDFAKGLTSAKGDLLVHNGTTYTKLPVGANGLVLTADSAEDVGMKWAADGGGSSSSIMSIWDDCGAGTRNNISGNSVDYFVYLIRRCSGDGLISQLEPGDSGHPGVYSIGYEAGGLVGRAALEGTATVLLGGGETQVEWLIYLPDLSDVTNGFVINAGLVDDATSPTTPENGVFLRYTHSSNSGNWVGRCITATVSTDANSSDAVVADTWIKLKVVVNADASEAAFFVDGVEIDNSPVTTNIPTAQVLVPYCGIQRTAGSAVDRFMYVDYMSATYSLTTPR